MEFLSFFAGVGALVFFFWVLVMISVWGENENRIFTQLVTASIFIGMLLYLSPATLSWLAANMWYVLGYFAFAHFPIGVLWALYEWKEFCVKRLKWADTLYKNQDGTFKAMLGETERKDPIEYSKTRWEEMKPDFRKEIDRISSWIVFWWFHLVEFLISDLVNKLCRVIINKIGIFLQRITDSYWK